MNLKNHTRYHGTDLRTHIIKAMKREGVNHRRYTVLVKYYSRKGQNLQGKATIGLPYITLFMNKEKHPLDLLHGTLSHEIHHTLGLRHDCMRGSCTVIRNQDYAGQFLSPLPEPEKKQEDIQLKRYLQANGKLK